MQCRFPNISHLHAAFSSKYYEDTDHDILLFLRFVELKRESKTFSFVSHLVQHYIQSSRATSPAECSLHNDNTYDLLRKTSFITKSHQDTIHYWPGSFYSKYRRMRVSQPPHPSGSPARLYTLKAILFWHSFLHHWCRVKRSYPKFKVTIVLHEQC